jgi:hypothetical protein
MARITLDSLPGEKPLIAAAMAKTSGGLFPAIPILPSIPTLRFDPLPRFRGCFRIHVLFGLRRWVCGSRRK